MRATSPRFSTPSASAGPRSSGMSIGGVIAQELYRQRPDLVAALVLCDTAAKIGTDESWDERIAAVERGGVESIADTVLERWFTADFRARRADELAGFAPC